MDPANKNTSNQNEAEELNEVSFTLQNIKKKYDYAKKMANAKQEELEKVKREIEQVNTQLVKAEGPTGLMRDKLANLDGSLGDTKNLIDIEHVTNMSLKHMIGRMKQDYVAINIKSANKEKSLKNKSGVMELEHQKSRGVKEQRLQSKATVDRLMENIEKEHNETQVILSEI